MRYAKNLAGLAIVIMFFATAFFIAVAMVIFAFALITGGSFGLLSLLILGLGGAGVYMMGGVLWLFVRNFNFRELMAPDLLTSRDDAPVAIEIRLDKGKSRKYLVDSRRSPRATNPRKLGRGVFIMDRKRGQLLEDKEALVLMDGDGTKIKNVRNIEDKIYFDMKSDGKNHTIVMSAITEHTTNFAKKESWDALIGGPDVSKEKRAEEWADSLKRAK